MARSNAKKTGSNNMGIKPWAAVNIDIFTIAVNFNINVCSRCIFNKLPGLLVPIESMLVT